MSLYSVVVPVYNSEHTLEELYRRLEKVFREVIKEDFELILVDDGSKDRSFEVMTELRNKDQRVRIIQMARNFGQHPALLCGFAHVRGDFVVTMDDDLQHQPEELPKIRRWPVVSSRAAYAVAWLASGRSAMRVGVAVTSQSWRKPLAPPIAASRRPSCSAVATANSCGSVPSTTMR